jgi:RNA polymerase sigma-70 factor (ECF subfamily)
MSGAAHPMADGDSASTFAPAAAHAPSDAAAATRRAADFALLDRTLEGDRAAFAVLVERHHLVLASLVRQRAGPRAPVEDLVQETFARALANLGGFRRRASFLTWTASIALNLATDWKRRERRRARLAPRADVDGDEVATLASRDVHDAAQRREESERARAALDALPDSLRLAVTLRVVEDLSYEDVASRLAVSVPRVRTWVSRGLGRLRRSLEVRHDGR